MDRPFASFSRHHDEPTLFAALSLAPLGADPEDEEAEAVPASAPPPAVTPLDISEFNTIAKPLIWAFWSNETLISRLSIVPFAVEPRSTAGGCG